MYSHLYWTLTSSLQGLIEKLGIMHVKGILLFGPPG